VGEGGSKSLKMLTGLCKSQFLACFGYISIKIGLKMNRERSERGKK